LVAVLEVVQLTASLRALAPWTHAPDLPAGEWDRYIATARDVQRADPPAVEEAIAEFLGERAGFEGAEDETRVFLLLRLVFDLPERAPADQREAYAGWVNWPPPADDGTVSLSWPIAWRDGRPALVAPYEGAEGESYAGVEEYRRLRERYPYRDLPG
jgi:hypothetical protein